MYILIISDFLKKKHKNNFKFIFGNKCSKLNVDYSLNNLVRSILNQKYIFIYMIFFSLSFFLLFLFYFALESVSSVDAQAPKSKSSQKRRNRAIAAAAQGELSTNPSKSIASSCDNAVECK